MKTNRWQGIKFVFGIAWGKRDIDDILNICNVIYITVFNRKTQKVFLDCQRKSKDEDNK